MLLGQPRTAALQRALTHEHDHRFAADLLFLERWEMFPVHGPAAALRVSQIRRANPELAAAIRHELITAQETLDQALETWRNRNPSSQLKP